jgi:hypothetical protein
VLITRIPFEHWKSAGSWNGSGVEECNDMPVLEIYDTKKQESAGQIEQKENREQQHKAMHALAKSLAIRVYINVERYR